MQDVLLTIVVAVMALALALMGCLLLGKKADRVRISAIALMVLVTFLLFLISTSMALNYYGLLCTEALFAFAIPTWCLFAACLSWME